MTSIASIKMAITPIAKQYGISKVFLFGSYAKGTANENSDIDLLIEKGKPMSLLKLSGMRQECEEALKLSEFIINTLDELASKVDEMTKAGEQVF